MSQTNNTPGLFNYRNGTIVLENVTDSGIVNGVLKVHTSGGWLRDLTEADDIERFGVEFNRYHAAKVAFISSEPLAEMRGCSATCCGDTASASAPGGNAERIGDHMHAEARNFGDLLGLLKAVGMHHPDDLPEPQVHIHRVELAGVDMNDMAAVRKAVEMTAAAIKLINGEDQAPAEPTEHVLPTRFMQMGILTDYCSPIREAIDLGYQSAERGEAHPAAKLDRTVRDALIALGWMMRNWEESVETPKVPAAERGRWGRMDGVYDGPGALPIDHPEHSWIRKHLDAGASAQAIGTDYKHPSDMGAYLFHLAYCAGNYETLQAKYDRACLERAEAEANLEAADKQLKVYNLRTAEMQASVTGMVDELYNLARPPKHGTPKVKAPLKPDDTF